MKRKLLYTIVILAMLGLSLPAAVPSAAAPDPGNMLWTPQPIPGGFYLITGLAVTPDDSTLFMATSANGTMFLWKSPTPVTSTSWSVVKVIPSTSGAVYLSPDYAISPTLYFYDQAGGGNIYRSTDGGTNWITRTLPTPAAIVACVFLSPVAITTTWH